MSETTDRLAAAMRETVRRIDVQETARKAIEDELIEWRDEGRSMPLRNNGLVVKFADGTPNDIIRFGPETAVVIGVDAIADELATALAAVVAAERAAALREALSGIVTHNGQPVSPQNLRWAATHEALCRSFIFDVLTGLADALDRAAAEEAGAGGGVG